MWGFHDKCSSRITPKNTVSFTRSITLLSIWIDISSVCLLWRGLKTIKFDFLKLMDSLFARHHWVNLSISEFKISGSKLKSLWEKNMFVSSAKRMKSTTFDTLHRSQIHRSQILVLFEFKHTEIFTSRGDCLLNTKL